MAITPMFNATGRIIGEVIDERIRQDAKRGEQNHIPVVWMAILEAERMSKSEFLEMVRCARVVNPRVQVGEGLSRSVEAEVKYFDLPADLVFPTVVERWRYEIRSRRTDAEIDGWLAEKMQAIAPGEDERWVI
jgi:hypothetical protein